MYVAESWFIFNMIKNRRFILKLEPAKCMDYINSVAEKSYMNFTSYAAFQQLLNKIKILRQTQIDSV